MRMSAGQRIGVTDHSVLQNYHDSRARGNRELKRILLAVRVFGENGEMKSLSIL
jgi:hypothetical protein